MLGIAGLARVRGPAYQWVMNDTTPSGRAARNALVIGTRASPLARAQSAMVGAALRAAHPGLEVSELVITTSGDRFLDRPLADIGGKGLFTKEIEDALASGAADIAVHSMKDVPTVLPDGLVIACMMAREDVRDVLVTRDRAITRSEDLPAGTRLGTASLRRGAQARARCKDLKLVNLRGNVGTRLQKINAGEADATFLALAGLKRLGITDIPGTVLAVQDMLPSRSSRDPCLRARGARPAGGARRFVPHAHCRAGDGGRRGFDPRRDGGRGGRQRAVRSCGDRCGG
jgi:porphobilinogen deaminase